MDWRKVDIAGISFDGIVSVVGVVAVSLGADIASGGSFAVIEVVLGRVGLSFVDLH